MVEGKAGLDQRLASVEVAKAHLLPRARPVRGIRRLYHHPLPHRLLPDRAAIAFARLGASAEWRLAHSRRDDMMLRARLLLGAEATADEQRRFARRSLTDMAIRREIEWRPWTARDLKVRGWEQFEKLASSGRGVVLASLHLGPFMSLPLAVVMRGFRLYISGGAPPGVVPTDESTRKLNVDFERAGGRWVHTGGTFELIRVLLEQGRICHLMLDSPRAAIPAMLAGRPVRLAGGIARLALSTNAPILPAYAIHERGQPLIAFEAPVMPGSGDDESSLIDAVAQRLDPALRAHLSQWRPPLQVLVQDGAR